MIIIMAWRNIWRNKMRSLVIMMSVIIGLFAGIMVLALYKGMLQGRVKTVIYAEVGHIQIHDSNFKKDYEPSYILKNGDDILTQLKKIPQIKSIALRSITQGMLSTTTGSAGIQINGIVSESENEVSQLSKKIIEGKGFDPRKKNEALIGKKLADKMKLKLNSKLVLTFIDSSANLVSGAFRVAAIFQSDNAPLDERNIYVRQNELNDLLSIAGNYHEIAVILDKNQNTEIIKQQLQKQFPDKSIESWREISPETDLMVNTVDVYSYIIIIIILFALAFGIINTMLMAILERTREIGMMTALGLNKLKMFLLVLVETIFLTIAGTPLGLMISWLIINYYNKHGLDLSGMGKDLMSSFGFSTIIYPEFPIEKIISVMLIVIITALLSSLFPAIKALKLQPVEALRK
ncbi:MAG TPA: FtsX-like permease family protein [Chitinophagaceae bacterium]|nr:FtsX-like permease family protein [Chitinophagaceae bacterium]